MKLIKYLQFTLVVEVEPVTREDGVNVWRAKSQSVKCFADGDTPESAVENLRDVIQTTENASVNSGTKYVKKEQHESKESSEENSNQEISTESESSGSEIEGEEQESLLEEAVALDDLEEESSESSEDFITPADAVEAALAEEDKPKKERKRK